MDSKPKIVLAGGSGFIGHYLTLFYKKSHEVIILTRSSVKSSGKEVIFRQWDGKTIGNWIDVLEGADALINLSGKSIDCRFTKANKKELLESRISTTQLLGEAIEKVKSPPKVWINASAGAMYQTEKLPNTEEETNFNNSFLGKMALDWESSFFEKELPNTRRVALRISLVLGKNGGVFPVLKQLTSFGLGGKVGNGKQKISWIHITDAIRAIDFIIKKTNIIGPVNFSTLNPVSNQSFMKLLRKKMNVFIGIITPSLLLKMGTFILRKEPSLLLDSVNFIPKRLLDEGFQFQFDKLDEAFVDLLK